MNRKIRKNELALVGLRIFAACYLIYLAKNMLTGFFTDDRGDLPLAFFAVFFIAAAIFFIVDGIRLVLRYMKQEDPENECAGDPADISEGGCDTPEAGERAAQKAGIPEYEEAVSGHDTSVDPAETASAAEGSPDSSRKFSPWDYHNSGDGESSETDCGEEGNPVE